MREALSNSELFSIRYGQSPQYTRASGLMNDPPEHTQFRSLFNRAFTPRVVRELEGAIERIASSLLDRMLPQHCGDLNHDFASPLPTMMIAELMGIPPEDHREFRRMSDELTATYNEPDPAASLAPRQAFDMYFQRVIDGRPSDERDPCSLLAKTPDPRRRTAWADLLQRVFEVDALRCPQCGGRMRILSAITEPDVARRILAWLDMPSRAPPHGSPTEGSGGSDARLAPELPWVEDPGFDFDQSLPGDE